MSAMSGLDAMTKQREKRAKARPMPPPRHTAPPVSTTETASGPGEVSGESNQPPSATTNTEPARTTATVEAAPAAPTPPEPTKPSVTVAAKPRPTTPKPKKNPAPAPSTDAAGGSTGRTVGPSTIYFDEETDDFLEEVSIAGRRTKPRIDSRSAIARFAMRRLMNEMSPEEVIAAIRAEIEAAGPSHNKPGRPRRY